MKQRKRPLSVEQILLWADEHRRRTGKYPSADSGQVHDEPAESWNSIDQALLLGIRGLPGRDTLARLLMRERGHRHLRLLPQLNEDTIVSWIQAHRERTGEWPGRESGPIDEAPGEVWGNIDQALRRGGRGLPGGDSLARLLTRRLGVSAGARTRRRTTRGTAELTVELILAWADAYRLARGKWPLPTSPPAGLPKGESWLDIDRALRQGSRGLPGGSSLVRLLVEHRHARNPQAERRRGE
jgi:hypothetical protein